MKETDGLIKDYTDENIVVLDKDLDKTLTINHEKVILVKNRVVIKANCPISIERKDVDVLIITGESGSSLKLINLEKTQPCIGRKTWTNMSYGRFTPGTCYLKELVIDGISVECESVEEFFSLGGYGEKKYFKVTCINGGNLICPETKGTRILRKEAYCPGGSTKYTDEAQYTILLDNEKLSYTSEQKEILNSIQERGIDTTKLENPMISPYVMKKKSEAI